MHKFYKKILFVLFFSCFFTLFTFLLFKNIFFAKSLIISFSVHPFDLCSKYSSFWNCFKKIYIIVSFISFAIISNFLFSIISRPFFQNKSNFKKSIPLIHSNNELTLLVGVDEFNSPVFITENGLYQNILVTGTIGSGKTSSLLYPLLKQLISFNCDNSSKISMLILDVKGNFYKQVLTYAEKFNRLEDVILIELNGKHTYNPLDKPNLKPHILANRLITILSLFNTNHSDSYWLDKSEQILAECIKLCRLYNNGYVNFIEIHKLIMNKKYYIEKINYLKTKFLNKELSEVEIYSLSTIIDFFENEFFTLDSKVASILKSEVSRITNVFVSEPDILKTFCPSREEITFHGFAEVISSGKIVVLNMNISEYSSLSKIIAAYLKLDFQSEILSTLSKTTTNISCFLSDEYHEYVTSTDANFFAQSREAKCINILATQSYTSLLNTLKDEYSTKVIIQNLVNKFWFRTDDIFTIEDIQKQIGKIEKTYTSSTISENAKTTNYNPLTSSFISKESNISESVNTYKQLDLVYDTNFFTQSLETFSCLSFISNGTQILPPQKIKTIPYFKDI